jgi:pimeloyl-ACP methyl ester carboxylesterase
MLRRAPMRISRLMLVSTLASSDTPQQTARRTTYLRLVESGQFDSVIEERLPILVHPDRRNDVALVSLARKMAMDTGPECFLRQQRAIMSRPDSRPMLAQINCPTTIIYGRQDGITALDHQREMLAAIRNARLEIIEQCGHMVPLEQPERFNRCLVEWWSN